MMLFRSMEITMENMERETNSVIVNFSDILTINFPKKAGKYQIFMKK